MCCYGISYEPQKVSRPVPRIVPRCVCVSITHSLTHSNYIHARRFKRSILVLSVKVAFTLLLPWIRRHEDFYRFTRILCSITVSYFRARGLPFAPGSWPRNAPSGVGLTHARGRRPVENRPPARIIAVCCALHHLGRVGSHSRSLFRALLSRVPPLISPVQSESHRREFFRSVNSGSSRFIHLVTLSFCHVLDHSNLDHILSTSILRSYSHAFFISESISLNLSLNIEGSWA